jgi:hypothetical protein
VAIPNLYQSSTSSGNDQIYYISGATAGQPKTYYFTLHNSNPGSASGTRERINDGSFVVINVPAGFTNISVTPPSGMSVSSSTTLDDGSTHIKIIVDPSSSINVNTKKTIAITATSPNVQQTTMYLFYGLVTGTTTDSASQTVIIGSVAETVVQVVP